MDREYLCDVVFVFGTSAELIKIWPLATDISTHSETTLMCTNQQPTELSELSSRLGIENVVHLRNPSRGNLVSRTAVPMWSVGTGLNMFRRLRQLKRSARKNKRGILVIVHGDTMSCLLGAIVARASRCLVGHVEAGLRSHDWRNPFPEELDRIITARLAHFHFCPDDIAMANLVGRRGIKINTHGNTSRDSMTRIQERLDPQGMENPYVLVSLHRAELLASREHLEETVKQLVRVAEKQQVVMVLDALTREALRSTGLLPLLSASRIDVRDKMAYPDFIQLVVGARRVVTDSGGLQEECGFLGIPCLIHRKATERFDGIGTTARLSMWEPNSIADFCSAEESEFRGERRLVIEESPTAIIISALKSRGILPE